MCCLYCTNDLPIDSNSDQISCGLCGTEYEVTWDDKTGEPDLRQMEQCPDSEYRKPAPQDD